MRPVFVALAASLLFGQTPEVNPVLVDVLVRTKAGPVTGLTKDDFILKDKGKPQNIELFTATTAHDAGFQPMPLSPGVGANRLSWRGEPIRGATVILFDRLNTAAVDQAFVRRQVLTMLASLKETDAVAFVSLWRTFLLVHDFTADPAPLIRAAKRMSAEPPQPAPADPAEQAMQKRLEGALIATQDLDQVARPPITMAAFRSIALHLMGLPGRKNLMWIAQSFPLTFGADVYRRNETANELSGTMAVMQEGNVAVYPVSPGGVGSGFADTSTRNDRVVEGRLLAGANAGTVQNPGTLGDGSNMQGIAEATGGRAYYNLNDITQAMRAVLDEAELSYTLGFHADPKGLDDRMHSLDVDLAKGKAPGAEVRFRKKYLATKRNMRFALPMPQLAMEPLDATTLGMAAVAQPDPAKPGFQRVDVSVFPGDLGLVRNGDRWTGSLELGLMTEAGPAKDAKDKDKATAPESALKTFALSFTDEQRTQVLAAGMLINGSIPTRNEPGAMIRVVLREPATGAAGSVRVPMR